MTIAMAIRTVTIGPRWAVRTVSARPTDSAEITE
jgi:hypothetical protein